jgi:hypothetical protein
MTLKPVKSTSCLKRLSNFFGSRLHAYRVLRIVINKEGSHAEPFAYVER